MVEQEVLGVFLGAIGLGFVHGIEPGHGWPVAASYAIDQTNTWLYGFAASTILGIGHLVSSIAMVAVFFIARAQFNLTQVNDPIHLSEGITIGGPIGIVAGVILIALGLREYRSDHSHGTQHADDHHHNHGAGNQSPADHDHGEGDHTHHDHDDATHSHHEPGLTDRLKAALPFVGGHTHGSPEEAAERGLWGIAGFAFVLGFAHEEEFEIIGLCLGAGGYCLELMTVYAITVLVGIVGLTMLLIAGYEEYEEEVEHYSQYFPLFSATVLILMGLGFITGLF